MKFKVNEEVLAEYFGLGDLNCDVTLMDNHVYSSFYENRTLRKVGVQRYYRLKTQEEYLNDAILKHGDRYDYSKLIYKKNYQKVEIICKVHGSFFQGAGVHLSGGGCSKCAIEYTKNKKKLLLSDVLENFKKVHGDRYDYSKIEPTQFFTDRKVEIICKVHGSFFQRAYSHIIGSGCLKCSGRYSYTTEEFLEMCKKVHADRYDYSQVVYIGNKSPIKIICKKHGVFEQRPNNHLIGEGCNKCGKESMAYISRLTYDKFLKKAKKVHKGRYEYIGFESEYTTVDDTFIRVVCKKHGEFKQKVHPHLGGAGCPSCNASKGEYRIKMWLDENNITYEPQKTFYNCINPDTKWKLRFDFYIPYKNLIIEFDGKQHFEMSNFCNDVELAKELFKKTKKHDQIKNEFVNNNKINILRISYKEFNKIEEILKYELLKKNDI